MKRSSGQIITFYSYKGGTGRSMALANVAWILASAGKRVLAIDWDMEAPGLHRYFRPFLHDADLETSEGVIDFVTEYCLGALDHSEPAVAGQSAGVSESWCRTQADLGRYTTSLEWSFPEKGGIDFVPSGRQSAEYSTRVNTFDWKRFYERFLGGLLIETLRERLAKGYDYVLIDSRTGVSDTSGICTLQFPDSLAVCFTLNNQSIEGLHSVLSSIVRQREQANRPIEMYPIPMRIDLGEAERLEARRKTSRQRLDRFLSIEDPAQRELYWKEVEVLYVPIYSYEETLASFRESGGAGSVLGAYERIAYHLSGRTVAGLQVRPSEEARSRVLANFAGAAPKAADSTLAAKAEDLYQSLTSHDQEELRRLFVRLVKLVAPGMDESVALDESELKPKIDVMLAARDAGLLQVHPSRSAGETRTVFELADQSLLWSWPRMVNWLSRERAAAKKSVTVPLVISPEEEHRIGTDAAQFGVSGMSPERWGPLRTRYAEMRPRRLLSIDGGGVRTILSLEILRNIERQLSEKLGASVGFRLCDYFDYIAGTSTGAIVAAGLARGMSVGALAAAYRVLVPEMFEKNSLLRRVQSYYTADPLRSLLQEIFGANTDLSPENLRCLLLLVMRNLTTDSPWPISSNPNAKYNDQARHDSNLRIPLWQLIRASAAAPVYFPPEVIQWDRNDPTKTFVMTDGGVSVYNNPAFLLYRMATMPEYRLGWRTGERNLLLVSVGTGASREPGKTGSNMNIISSVAGLSGQIMADAAYEQDVNCRTIGRCTWGKPLDREVGTMIPDQPLHQDLGRDFLYARYTADLSRQGLDALGCQDIPGENVQMMDSTEHMDDLVRVGCAASQQVRMEHFGPFVE